jgi:hypothetical protein
MDGNVKGYSQWFPEKKNNVTDTLSWDWHRSKDKLTKILHSNFPKQMPAHFEILPLPSVISSWLIFTLQRLPANAQLWEQHTTRGLELGGDGSNIANLSDATASTWTLSQDNSKFSCWAHLPWLSEQEDVQGRSTKLWLKAQSDVPFHIELYTTVLPAVFRYRYFAGIRFNWAVGISVGITSLAGTPFFRKRGAGCVKKGAGAPFFTQKGGQCPLLREKGVPAKKMIPKCTDRDFLRYQYGKYQEIPTDTDRKIPI